jgi:hypothetical protein
MWAFKSYSPPSSTFGATYLTRAKAGSRNCSTYFWIITKPKSAILITTSLFSSTLSLYYQDISLCELFVDFVYAKN